MNPRLVSRKRRSHPRQKQFGLNSWQTLVPWGSSIQCWSANTGSLGFVYRPTATPSAQFSTRVLRRPMNASSAPRSSKPSPQPTVGFGSRLTLSLCCLGCLRRGHATQPHSATSHHVFVPYRAAYNRRTSYASTVSSESQPETCPRCACAPLGSFHYHRRALLTLVADGAGCPWADVVWVRSPQAHHDAECVWRPAVVQARRAGVGRHGPSAVGRGAKPRTFGP
jgi:hypothetical protein